MLMIIVESDAATVVFRLVGCLAGAGVGELSRRWSAITGARPRPSVSIDLVRVNAIDAVGRAFLAHARRHGARLIGGDAHPAGVNAADAEFVPTLGSTTG